MKCCMLVATNNYCTWVEFFIVYDTLLYKSSCLELWCSTPIYSTKGTSAGKVCYILSVKYGSVVKLLYVDLLILPTIAVIFNYRYKTNQNTTTWRPNLSNANSSGMVVSTGTPTRTPPLRYGS